MRVAGYLRKNEKSGKIGFKGEICSCGLFKKVRKFAGCLGKDEYWWRLGADREAARFLLTRKTASEDKA